MLTVREPLEQLDSRMYCTERYRKS